MSRAHLLLVICWLSAACPSALGQCAKKMSPRTADVTKAMEPWEKIDYASRLLRDSDLQKLPPKQLMLVRGIIFGRHGREFKEMQIQNYLWTRSWYRAGSFSNSMLNDTERANLDKVRLAEAARHEKVQPGDLRLWMTRRFPLKKVNGSRLLDLHIMRAEIEAIHGKTFASEPALQNYFDERYWYRRNPAYNARALSAIERANAATLAKAESNKGHSGIRPEDVVVYQTRVLPTAALGKSSLSDLRLLRNGFYAMHGRPFKSEWMLAFLDSQEWYEVSKKPTPLSPIEKKNVLAIVRREDEIHKGLAANPVNRQLIGSLGLQDVRNLKDEIYARHGRVFKTKWLESYFASQPWYKPNQQYSDSLLNAVEKRNIRYLAQVQQKLESQMAQEEG